MKTIELQLDDDTFARAQQLAKVRRYSLELFIADIIKRLAQVEPQNDPMLGMFAEEPDIIDQVMTEVMAARETHPLRLGDG